MGTINYKTSDYITIGYNCNYIDYDDDFYNDIISDYYEQVAQRLKDYNFYYFHITVEPGYYEGFSINIENNFPVCYDNYFDKIEALKEITILKKFLLKCINNYECCAVYPGWCTGYSDYNDSIRELKLAILEMRQDVKNTPTYSKYITSTR